MDIICGICLEELGSEKSACSLPCGHVKHIACLTKWCKVRKSCPTCLEKFIPSMAFRKRLYFDMGQSSDNKMHKTDNGAVKDDSVFATNKALMYQLDKIKAEVDAAQACVNDLEESNCHLEMKLYASEAQNMQSCERNRQLIVKLHTLATKNQENLERNRNLEQELSNSQTKTRDLEAKFDQTQVGQLIKFMEKESECLKNCEVFRLQNSLEAKENEIARLKHLLENKNIELEYEQKLRRSIAERLEKKEAESAKLAEATEPRSGNEW